MRVVIAPFNGMSDVTLAGVRSAGHEILCTGQQPQFYPQIAAAYPDGWLPDVFVCWSPEYYPVPGELEAASCFKVGVFGDWNLGGQAVQQIAGAFDLLIADVNGTERLRGLGYRNVVSVPLWSYDPDLHRCLPNVDRDLDIVLIGSFNHDVQQERARWLGRVARLSSRYRVCLTGGVNGEAYTELMNRAKIVFNRSIRGEINMRAYEAPACGALLFYERDNREIRSLFTDRKECVLYGDDDLEPLLDFYLTHDEERQSIVDAGYRRVQNETPSCHMQDMFAIIERKMEEHPRTFVVPLETAPDWDRELRRTRQWLLTSDPNYSCVAEQTLRKAEEHGAELSIVAGLRGYLLAQAGQYLAGVDRSSAWAEAQTQWQTAIDLNPTSVSARLNLASMLIEIGSVAEAERILHEARELLSEPRRDKLTPGELFWRCRFTAFGVEYDRIEIECRHDSQEWHSAMHALLRWRTDELLSDLAFNGERYREAEQLAGEALALLPTMAQTHFRHGRALNALGLIEAAMNAYRAALDINPFLVEARGALAQLLIDIERPSDAIALLEDWSSIIAGCPFYNAHIPECRRLEQLARQTHENSARPQENLRRLLAFPEWNMPGNWQELVADFAARREVDPTLLMLWADPRTGMEPQTLLYEIGFYLRTYLRLQPPDFPSITVVTQSLEPRDRWKLFYIADAVLNAGAIPNEFKDVFEASRLPVLPSSDSHYLVA